MKKEVIISFVFVLTGLGLIAQEKTAASPEELAKKLANPVANLISVPLQNNTDYGIGTNNGSKNTLNIQPVIPIRINAKINLITRYILPVISQHDITSAGAKQTGLSDMTVSAFFSPVNSKNGIIWGAGPALLIPTGTNDYLTTKKWGAGPTALVLKQAKSITFGFLANQLWSYAGSKERVEVNQLFFQPFFTHNWKSGAGLGINAEITQNWVASTTLAFINPIVSAVTKLGKQTISVAVGPRIPVAGPSELRPDFGYRAVLTFVFPK